MTAAKGRPRDPVVDRAVLDATLSVLAEEGPVRLTLRAVAERAGVARTTVHRRWPTKDALLVAAMAHLLDQEDAVADTGSARGELVAVCLARARLCRTGAGHWLVLVAAQARANPGLRSAPTALAEAERAPFAQAISRAHARGELAGDVDTTVAVEQLYGPVVTRLLSAKEVSAEFATVLVDQVLSGLRSRPEQPARRSRRGR